MGQGTYLFLLLLLALTTVDMNHLPNRNPRPLTFQIKHINSAIVVVCSKHPKLTQNLHETCGTRCLSLGLSLPKDLIPYSLGNENRTGRKLLAFLRKICRHSRHLLPLYHRQHIPSPPVHYQNESEGVGRDVTSPQGGSSIVSAGQQFQPYQQGSVNAWDNVPGIESYVRARMELFNQGGMIPSAVRESEVGDSSSSLGQRRNRRESLILTGLSLRRGKGQVYP